MPDYLHEPTVHGNANYPFALYHMHRLTQTCAFPLHWHEEIEIILVQQGILELTIERTHYQAKPGDIFIVNGGQIHAMVVEQVPTIYATILFPISSLLFQQNDIIRKEYLVPLADGIIQFPNETDSLSFRPELQQKLETIIALYHRKDKCYELRIRTLLLEMICDFFSEDGAFTAAQKSPGREKQRAILSYIHQNYCSDLTLDMLAAEFHMVPKYFSRYFKNTFHITLTEHIAALRLDSAAELLRRTDLPVTEIALQTGFNSCSYFNKQFRNAFRITPTEYRRKKEASKDRDPYADRPESLLCNPARLAQNRVVVPAGCHLTASTE